MTTTPNSPAPLNDVLKHTGGSPLRRRLPWIIVAAVAAVLLAWKPWSASGGKSTLKYQTEAASRGDLTVTVSATGNLQPVKQIDVGSEVSGTIDKVYVDENDPVHKGQVLATLDTSRLTDQLTRSRAALAAAEAQVQQVDATLTQEKQSLKRMQDLDKLSGGKLPARSDLDTANAVVLRDTANLAAAKAAVQQARAQASSDETSLNKATIRSPIDGVVLIRKIEPGQTVAASLQAPVLFTLAEDLSRMELQVNVDEADIAHVKTGQPAHFTVDAWSGRLFPAQLTRVGLGSLTVDNVVSYKTILRVDNDDLSLRPGMTATAEIVTEERKDVLLIPNAALRFTPDFKAEKEASASFVSRLMPRAPSTGGRRPATPGKNGQPRVWVVGPEGKPSPVKVHTGATNGQLTEITGGDLKEGMKVIIDSVSAKS